MRCDACGHQNIETALACVHCGAALMPPTAAAPGFAPPKAVVAAADSTRASRLVFAADDDSLQTRWKAVIGPRNQSLYLAQFEKMHAGAMVSWHWPALFATFYWLLYRKMWGWALIYFFTPVAFSFVAGIVAGLTRTPVLAGLLTLCQFAFVLIVPPLLAHWLYYRHAQKIIARADAAVSREMQLAQIEKRGGTSWAVLIFVGVLVFVFVVGILAAVAIPAYQDYVRRAKRVEATPLTSLRLAASAQLRAVG
jgi:hypothetical protein